MRPSNVGDGAALREARCDDADDSEAATLGVGILAVRAGHGGRGRARDADGVRRGRGRPVSVPPKQVHEAASGGDECSEPGDDGSQPSENSRKRCPKAAVSLVLRQTSSEPRGLRSRSILGSVARPNGCPRPDWHAFHRGANGGLRGHDRGLGRYKSPWSCRTRSQNGSRPRRITRAIGGSARTTAPTPPI